MSITVHGGPRKERLLEEHPLDVDQARALGRLIRAYYGDESSGA